MNNYTKDCKIYVSQKFPLINPIFPFLISVQMQVNTLGPIGCILTHAFFEYQTKVREYAQRMQLDSHCRNAMLEFAKGNPTLSLLRL